MKSFRSVLPFLGVTFVLAGCSGETGSSASTSQTQNALSANVAAPSDANDAVRSGRPHAGRPHGGPDFLVFAALHENIGLTDAQRKTIEGLTAKGAPKAPPAPDKAHTSALAAAIRAGKVDSALLKPPADMQNAMKQHMSESAAKLKALHDTLSKEQRVALVDAMSAKRAQHVEHADRGERKGPPDGAEGRKAHGGPFGGLLRDIELTQAQKDEIKTKLEAQRPSEADREAMKTKMEEMKKSLDAKLQAFKNDDFDATAFATPPAAMAMAKAHGPMNELSIIVPLLDAQQREKLAQKIEQGPSARPQH